MISLLSLFRNKFNKSNKTGTNVRLNLSYDIKIMLKSHFLCKKLIFCHNVCNGVMDALLFPEICKPLVFYGFYCIALFHSQTQCHIIN